MKDPETDSLSYRRVQKWMANHDPTCGLCRDQISDKKIAPHSKGKHERSKINGLSFYCVHNGLDNHDPTSDVLGG